MDKEIPKWSEMNFSPVFCVPSKSNSSRLIFFEQKIRSKRQRGLPFPGIILFVFLAKNIFDLFLNNFQNIFFDLPKSHVNLLFGSDPARSQQS